MVLDSFTVGVMASGLLVKVGLGLLGLYSWSGMLRLVTSWSRPGFVVIPKALAMAHLSAAASLLAILPQSFSRFCPLAPYCYTLLPGWHPTAHCRWLASPLPGGSTRLPLPFDRLTFPRVRLVTV